MADNQPDEDQMLFVQRYRATQRVRVAEALRDIAKAEWPRINVCVTLLLKLLRNIEREPDNTKFRRLSRRNATLSKDLFAIYGIEGFLHHVGFDESEESFWLDDEDVSSVSWAIGELKAFLAAESDKQYRRERDVRIARERAAESKSQVWRSSKRPRLLATEGAEQFEGQAAEWNPSVIAHDGSGDYSKVTFTVQMVTLVTEMKMSKQATLGDLRASLALKRACQPEQVKLVLVSTTDDASKQLFGDHRSLEVCEVTNGCVICASFMNADEFQDHIPKVASIRESKSMVAQELDKLAKETSWHFTQEVLASAELSGVLDKATARTFKRRMHIGELSMKEVRDQIIDDAGAKNGCSPFQEIIDKYLGSSSFRNQFEGRVRQVSSFYARVDDDREHAHMIANENRKGLIEACNRMSGR